MNGRAFLELHRDQGSALTREVLRPLVVGKRRWSSEVVQDVDAVAWVLSLVLRQRLGGVAEAAPDVQIALQSDELRAHVRMSRPRWAQALDRLEAGQALVRGGGRQRPWVRFERGVLVHHPILERLDSAVVLGALRGKAAAHSVLWALAESHRGDPRVADSITLEDLARETGYGKTSIRSGVEALEEAGLVVRHFRSGSETEYRLTPRLFGDAEDRVAVPSKGAEAPAQALESVPVLRSPPTGSPQPSDHAPEMVVEIAGREIRVGPGVEIAVELDGEGRVVHRIGPYMTFKLGP